MRSTSNTGVLLVIWEDITGIGGAWHKASKLPRPAVCETVGWVLQWEPCLVISGSRITEDGTHGDTTAIPWGVVREARWLDHG